MLNCPNGCGHMNQVVVLTDPNTNTSVEVVVCFLCIEVGKIYWNDMSTVILKEPNSL